jgi:hypothetical protein
LCFLLPGMVAWALATVWVPLELHQAEEYLTLAQSPDGGYSLLRPPGYVFFLHWLDVLSGGFSPGAYGPIYFVQSVLLGLATVVFFLVARRWLDSAAACVLALAFGCNPLSLVLAGYIHYDLLHLALLVFTCGSLVKGFGEPRIAWRWVVCAGILAGLATLTRPMTLLFPAVLAGALTWLRGHASRRAALAWLVCATVMGLTLAPRILENYQRTSRLLPVNAQTGAAFWPMTVMPLHPTSDNFPWITVWSAAGDALVRSHLGPAAAHPDIFVTQPLVMDDLCKADAWARFQAQPAVYFKNVAANLLFFWTGDSRRFIQAFLFYQIAERPSRTAAWAVGYFAVANAVLHLLAAGGLVLAWLRRERALVLASTIFVTLWLVHSLVYLDGRYLYAGLPFFFWFAAYGLRELLPCRWPRDLTAASLLAGLSFIGVFWLLL